MRIYNSKKKIFFNWRKGNSLVVFVLWTNPSYLNTNKIVESYDRAGPENFKIVFFNQF